ncbi:MAG TPA: alpha/beta hydrolase [Terriglobales bacterium]|nr:alpha/beta hydrolase [Terriglobales bacterium]
MMVRVCFALLFLFSLFAHATDQETTGFVTAHDGARLSYRKLGHGPQTVIVPGGFLFDGAFDRFATAGRTVIFYDMRNRGRSDAVKDLSQVTIQNDVRDLEAVRAHFGVKKASLIGYSYLGFLVVLYAMDHPEHVERIIQLGAVPRQWDTEYPAQLTNRDAEQVVDMKAWNAVQELKKQGYNASHPKEYCEKEWAVFRRMLVGKPESVEKLPGWCDLPNEWPVNFSKHLEAHFVGSVQKLKVPKEEVAKVTVPVLTIHGTLDRNAAYGAGREWALTLPNARLVTVKGAAHQSWADEPELVLGSIETFLSGDWPKEAEKINSLE